MYNYITLTYRLLPLKIRILMSDIFGHMTATNRSALGIITYPTQNLCQVSKL